jgi:hypothetical protein
MTTKREDRDLPVRVNDAQAIDYGENMSNLVNEQTAIETDLSAYGSEKRKRLREIKKEVKRLAVAIHDRQELASVQCDVVSDFSTNSIRIIRLDTKETVETRAMTAEERQTELDLGAAKGPKRKLRAVAKDEHEPEGAH